MMESAGLRFQVKAAVWLRSGLRFQVKPAVWLQPGLHPTAALFPNCDISHGFNSIGMYSPLGTHFPIFRHGLSPQQPLLGPIAYYPGRTGCVFLAAPLGRRCTSAYQAGIPG